MKTSKGEVDIDEAKILSSSFNVGLQRKITGFLEVMLKDGRTFQFRDDEALAIQREITGPFPLTFETLRAVNLARCEESFHSMEEWSLNDWLVALGGEVGEAMNYAKKLWRLEGSKPGVRAKMSREELLVAIKKEFGDILTYLDLSATKLGFRLEDCVRDKFNEVSDDIGSAKKL